MASAFQLECVLWSRNLFSLERTKICVTKLFVQGIKLPEALVMEYRIPIAISGYIGVPGK